MPIRIPRSGVRVYRDGQSISPKIGVEFNFTAAELEDLKVAGAKLDKVVREVEDEAPAVEAPARGKGAKAAKGAKAEAPAAEEGGAAEGGEEEAL